MIGTVTPTSKLEVAGRFTVSSSDGNAAGWLESSGESGATNKLVINGARGVGGIVFQTNSAERARIDASGNVGIGTSVPTAKLHVADGTIKVAKTYYGSGLEVNYGSTTSGGLPAIKAVQDATTGGLSHFFISRGRTDGAAGIAMETTGVATSAGAPGWFAGLTGNVGVGAGDQYTITTVTGTSMGDTGGGQTFTPRFTILPSGNVGIGTMAPTTKLEVAGTIKATAFEGPVTSSSATVGTGTSLLPSLTFTGDADTGFWNSGSNQIGVTVGGVGTIFDFGTAGMTSTTTGGALIKTGNGDQSTPTFSFAGDTDTGWFRPLADTLAASTGGTERVRIASDGHVGIGTTSPGTKLHVYGGNMSLEQPVGNAQFNINHSGAGGINYRLVSTASSDPTGVGNFHIYDVTNTAHRLTINSSGSVGVGTTSPSGKLEVNSGAAGTTTGLIINTTSVGANTYEQYKANGTVIGSITSAAGANVAFNTTSDVRLKGGFAPVYSPLKTLNQIEVNNFYYLNDPEQTRMDGFKAQQLHQVLPYAVTVPEKDVDDDGSIIPWQADYSKVVPLITAAIQELYHKLLGTQADVAELKAADTAKTRDIASVKAENAQLKADMDAQLKAKDQKIKELEQRLERIEKSLKSK